MNIAIKIDDPVSPKLDKLSKDTPEIHDASLGKIAESYRDYVRTDYLRGQMLGFGAPYKAMKFRRRRQGLWWVYPGRFNALAVFETGRTIRPNKASILRFWDGERMIFAHQVTMPRLPFISTSLRSFMARGQDTETGSKWFWRELDKRGLAT